MEFFQTDSKKRNVFLVFFIYLCMKKTRFFYGMNYFLLAVLGWLLLFYKAIEVNENAKEEDLAWEKEAVTGTGEENKAATAESVPITIRVLLMDSGYRTYYHPSVTLQMDNQELTYTADSPELQAGSLVLDSPETGIRLLSIERQENPPVYSGSLEIRKTNQGLLLINELPLETYLEGVVPSEMPASYEMEALMAQAVCARTYAVCQIRESKLQKEYGADVDDSVNFQVYQNFMPTQKTSQAVKKTEGQILTQNGEPVTAYYFSTSAGVTSTDEIWGEKKAAPYLNSVKCQFDQDLPWSSWEVELPWEFLEEQLADNGVKGIPKSLQTVKKSSSGAAILLQVITDEEEYEIEGEYEIRSFLSPKGQKIKEKDGTITEGTSLLPSAYFDLDFQQGKSLKIKGKGYGHGVGMSQNGANEMAKEGYTWQEILEYFFRDIEILDWKMEKVDR